jgi:NAD-dependent SIR2 family protein deacetylase
VTDLQNETLEKAAGWLREADGLLITAGAGMGVDSGLPDFRGRDGFWRAYPALRHHGFSFEDMANPARFAEHPELAWGFYGHRLKL